ncbi:DNA-binding response regulator [Marivirga tractuosa]|uniref:Two component transcriptional regulator, LytTR family n=1 Tax=Marivirga tractuosa (strain ATCC 23168 / DSM 4126 / NBRC 15989 / NCIMB 1408 / VKM B-1430 / H-43) TaxID=643867 RepID=E4TPV2_MARTH|nr:LytTR family DNA-binding domain-containing protein [Marivirga tractuosa]ADR23639.1 two component transcriptional regulator, LytTR family [Marivirga tractuosa DSM 4126]BDD15680.1 DNA-binding response regulator [Marivirga tractuosa]
MRVLIIEDERPAATRMKQLIVKYLPQADIYGHLDSISSAVKWLQNEPTPDLIFCDIELADGQSFEIFEQVEIKSPIIFTTAYDQFAIKAFKLNSIDYLLKPIDPEELEQAILKFKNQQFQPQLDLGQIQQLLKPQGVHYKSRFMVKIGEKIQSIPTDEVSYFFSAERTTFMQTNEVGKRYILDYTLDQIEEMLEPTNFFRLNRKYIASFKSIDQVLSYSNSRLKIKLKNSEDNDILISREKVAKFKEWLDD